MDETNTVANPDVALITCEMCGKPFRPKAVNLRPFYSADCEGLWMAALVRKQRSGLRKTRGGYHGF
jgi:hypothetical protein